MWIVGGWFTWALVGTGSLSLVFAVFAWRKRAEPGGIPLVVYNLAIAIALFAYAFDIVSTTRSTQLLLVLVWLPAQALVATTWLYVAIEFAGLQRWANRRTAALLWLEPALFAVLVVTPSTRSLFFDLPDAGVEGSLFFVGAEGSVLLSAHYAFLFTLMLAATLLFVRLFVRSKHLYRVQSLSVAVAAVGPWTILLVQAVGVAPVEDPSSIAFALSGIALTVGLYRFKTLDPFPAAREAIIEEMGDGVIALDEDGIVSTVNPAARELFEDDSLVGTPVSDLFPNWAQLFGTATGPTETDWQELTLPVDGSERVLEVQLSPFRDRFDRHVGRLVVLRDVTERTRREQNLARFKTIFESVTDRVYVLDSENRFVMVNEPFATLVGVEPESLRGEPFQSLLADRESVATAVPTEQDTVELTINTAGDKAVPCEVRRAPISFEGLEAGSVGILHDISQRKQIETSLQRTTERLETLVEASPLAIMATDPEGRVEVWNDAAREMFGWSAADVTGESIPMVSGEREERLRTLFERVAAGERITGYEMQLDRADGGVVDASISLAPVTDESGTVQGIVGIAADITDQKERERQLERQNKRLDEFAGLISHDLRNPLQVGSAHLELLGMTADLDEDAMEHLGKSQSAFERMETLIDDALTLAREGKDIGERRPLVLDELARRAWEGVSTPAATLEIDASRSDPLEGDPSRVLELFENLFRNAIEHGLPEEYSPGSLPVDEQAAGSARTQQRPESRLTVRVEVFDGGFAVEDDGAGIPETDRGQLFEPGYTTAKDGTGLGLAIVNRVAQAHGWEVSVLEGVDGGARFEFTTQ